MDGLGFLPSSRPAPRVSMIVGLMTAFRIGRGSLVTPTASLEVSWVAAWALALFAHFLNSAFSLMVRPR
jgi:hypothetical protein